MRIDGESDKLMASSVLRVVPVIDVLRGEAVHAVGGDRRRYRPLRSILHPDPDPLELARACRDALGLSSLYLADLDAITRDEPNQALHRALAGFGLKLWIDAGLRDEGDLPPLLDLEAVSIIAGLESLRGPDSLEAMLDRAGPERLIVSLDLWNGRPITRSSDAWSETEAIGLANRIIGLGVRRLLLLDLTRVGMGAGPGTETLLSSILETNSDIEVSIGGGVTDSKEIERHRERGAAAVLIGSALHDGRIGREQLSRFDR